MLDAPNEALYASAFLVVSYALVAWYNTSKTSTLPGPPADILLGHARKIPRIESWKTYGEWSKLYGDVIQLHALGHNILVVNTVKAARELLEKKSLYFSDRPPVPVLSLMGWGLTLPLLRYGDRFKKARRMMQGQLGNQAIGALRPIQKVHIQRFLKNSLSQPDAVLLNIHRLIAGAMIHMTYGHEVTDDNDDLAVNVEKAVQLTSTTGTFGVTLLDLFPPLCKIPSWMPGMGLKRLALEIRKLVDTTITMPFDEVVGKKNAGIATQGVVSNLLDDVEDMKNIPEEEKEDIKNLGGAIYNAGTDSTKSALQAFFILMTIYPDVAKKAQQEIDSVVGSDRLPTLDDRPALPYLDCIIKEIFRFQPPIPMGLPHCAIKTLDYNGHGLNPGTMALTNIWQMMNDETHFPNPEKFLPERHENKVGLKPGDLDAENFEGGLTQTKETDPSSIVFGFGRRVCPGKFLVDATLWWAMASTLATFDIVPYKDPITGEEDKPVFIIEGNVVVHPAAFKCTLKPRSEKHERLISEL